jgi:hypothetical protein
VISEDVLQKEIQIFAPCREIRQKRRFEYLWREELELNPKNSKGKVKRGLGRTFCFQS